VIRNVLERKHSDINASKSYRICFGDATMRGCLDSEVGHGSKSNGSMKPVKAGAEAVIFLQLVAEQQSSTGSLR
jgi:hypothetical protein